MLPQPHDIRLSLKRSRGRERILEYVVRRGDAYLQEIAQDLGMTEARVRAAIHGAPPEYRVELSLVGLRLLEYRKGRTLPYYVATPLGKDAQALRRKRHAR